MGFERLVHVVYLVVAQTKLHLGVRSYLNWMSLRKTIVIPVSSLFEGYLEIGPRMNTLDHQVH